MSLQILTGDCREVLKTLPEQSVNCCVCSPPYWGLRDYGMEGQLGLEESPQHYVSRLVSVFREVRRVMRDDGTLWLNLGDSYNGYMANQRATSISAANQESRPVFKSGHGRRTETLKAKDLVGIPWRVAFALQEDGWYLRSDIIWHKPNPMPESVTDRPTKAHEYLFLLSKSERYHYDAEAIKEQSITGDERRPYGSEGSWQLDGRPDEQRHGGKPRNGANSLRGQGAEREATNGPANRDGRDMATVGVGDTRNKRTVWTVPTSPYPEAHFATYPPDLIKPCILAGCPAGGTVLDPFGGSGTTGMVALELGRKAILIELNPEYARLAQDRCNVTPGLML